MEEKTISDNTPFMIPRDIIAPSATLLGLTLTAIGVLISISDESELVLIQNIIPMFILIVILFVGAVLFTTMHSILRRYWLWRLALFTYLTGWGMVGTVLVLVLIGNVYGIEALQIQLPQFDISFLTTLALSIVSVLAAISQTIFWVITYYRRKELKEVSKKIHVTSKEFDDAATRLKFESLNLNDSLVVLRSDIERELKVIAKENNIEMKKHYPIRKLVTELKLRRILDPNLSYSILYIYNFCSKAVHGEILPKKESELVQELGIKTLVNLKKISGNV